MSELCAKGLTHPENDNSVVIYSCLCGSKPVFFFFRGTQNVNLGRKFLGTVFHIMKVDGDGSFQASQRQKPAP